MKRINHVKIKRRSGFVPKFWRRITPPGGMRKYAQRRDWQLVLLSKNISFVVCNVFGEEHLYVPPLSENVARQEISAYIRENIPHKAYHYPFYPHAYIASFFVLLLFAWDSLIANWGPTPFFNPPQGWQDAGSLDSVAIKIYDQYYRLATALTLHADINHLLGNIATGALFLYLLARLIGYGYALLYTILGGIAGNALSLLFHTTAYRSIGFSTALFACVGIMAGVMLGRAGSKRKMLLPIGGAIALLAMVGTEGQNTDYTAHCCGLAAGFFIGFLQRRQTINFKKRQIIAAIISILVLILAWLCAFQQIDYRCF